jgi:hypothetical protein
VKSIAPAIANQGRRAADNGRIGMAVSSNVSYGSARIKAPDPEADAFSSVLSFMSPVLTAP